jgi:hypothetical protein
MPGTDPDDCHHMAAAVAGGAAVIVTWNLADFPRAAMARYGVRVVEPDEHLCELLDELPDEVAQVVERLAAEKRRPPMTPADLLQRLAKAGVTRFAERVAAGLGPSIR